MLSNPSVFIQLLIVSVYLVIVFLEAPVVVCWSPGMGTCWHQQGLCLTASTGWWVWICQVTGVKVGTFWTLEMAQGTPAQPRICQRSHFPDFICIQYEIKRSQADLITQIDLMSYLHAASRAGPECSQGRLQEPLLPFMAQLGHLTHKIPFICYSQTLPCPASGLERALIPLLAKQIDWKNLPKF